MDLVALERSPDHADAGNPVIAFPPAGDAGELLDARAKAAYRRRLSEIDEDLAEALAIGETARAAQAEAERDILMRELSRAVGLGGRSRRAGSAAERARSAVTRWFGSESMTPSWAITSIVRSVPAPTACTCRILDPP
jgi:cytochrome c-type biogenesis protein CcmH/NrfG